MANPGIAVVVTMSQTHSLQDKRYFVKGVIPEQAGRGRGGKIYSGNMIKF